MRVLESRVEAAGRGRLRVTTLLGPEDEPEEVPLGEGPDTPGAIPDRIVRALIDAHPEPLSLSQLQATVKGNRGTVNRQAWTLATNAPDLQLRLRGWVISVGRGLYALSPAARQWLTQSHD